MRFFSSLHTSASGLTAERLRMDTIAANLANAQATRTQAGGPYRRQLPVFSSREQGGFVTLLSALQSRDSKLEPSKQGVRVLGIVEDPAPPVMRYEPGHPDAGEDGYVAYPNVDVVMEMVDLITASRAYEANATAIDAAKQMALRALEIGR